ncbi:MAG: translation initiation factor IF-2 N-terminal domain-containing protein, partial [Desulfobacteraceae bacterium]|nr:translation initiation factor IF-2 N-terminal domain-containing protein [Desulfobacteraceae bacterium]
MAKRRVFELARELNMTNRELLDKMQEMNIHVSSHLGSLEDDTVNHIRNEVFGRKNKAEVEHTRVRPNVIRRRRKAASEPQAAAEKEPERSEQQATEKVEEPESTAEREELPDAQTPEVDSEAAVQKTTGPSHEEKGEEQEATEEPQASAEKKTT